jgi:hypothetical protein
MKQTGKKNIPEKPDRVKVASYYSVNNQKKYMIIFSV